jgi:hypothetical protein
MGKSPGFPTFLGIGAQKAGTTWLWENLRVHPDVFMTPVKEIHYFDRSTDYPSPNWISTERFASRLFGRNPHDRRFRRRLLSRIRRNLMKPEPGRIAWDARYLLGTYDDRWYGSLFRSPDHKVRGEITPAYSILSEADVRRIGSLMPGLRVIFVMREPVERTWSGVRINLIRGRPPSAVYDAIDSPAQELRSDYTRTISLWENVFSPDRFHVGFYDDLRDEPASFLSEVCRFLDIDPDGLDPGKFTGRFNTSRQVPAPPEYEEYIARKYLVMTEELEDRFGGPAVRWLARIRDLCDRSCHGRGSGS